MRAAFTTLTAGQRNRRSMRREGKLLPCSPLSQTRSSSPAVRRLPLRRSAGFHAGRDPRQDLHVRAHLAEQPRRGLGSGELPPRLPEMQQPEEALFCHLGDGACAVGHTRHQPDGNRSRCRRRYTSVRAALVSVHLQLTGTARRNFLIPGIPVQEPVNRRFNTSWLVSGTPSTMARA